MEDKIKKLLTPYWRPFFKDEYKVCFLEDAQRWFMNGWDGLTISQWLASEWAVRVDMKLINGLEKIRKKHKETIENQSK